MEASPSSNVSSPHSGRRARRDGSQGGGNYAIVLVIVAAAAVLILALIGSHGTATFSSVSNGLTP